MNILVYHGVINTSNTTWRFLRLARGFSHLNNLLIGCERDGDIGRNIEHVWAVGTVIVVLGYNTPTVRFANSLNEVPLL